MLATNYITTAWRNILNHKLFSAINIIGLAIGLAAVILIALFVRDELGYDNFWNNADNIYRTELTLKSPGRDNMQFVLTPGPVYHAIQRHFPQITAAARIANLSPSLILDGEQFVEDISLVDPGIINIFDFNVVSGDLSASLNDNSNLVLNETLAAKYFAGQNPIGKIVTLDFDAFSRDYKIGAVFRDLPKNSQLDIKSMALIVEKDWAEDPWRFGDWFSMGAQLFYTIDQAVNIADIENQMTDFIDRNYPAPLGNDENAKISDNVSIASVNVKDLHLKSVGGGEFKPRGNYNTVITFSAIALLILIIASINFMNLSTARATKRAREVSIRKVVGASRKILIIQFLGESILITIMGLLIALAIVEITLPVYNQALAKELILNYGSIDTLRIVFFTLGIGLLSGVYPAFILTNFRPSEILKANQSIESGSSVKVRSLLVILQFTISIALFVSTAVVYGQMQYVKNRDLGYNQDNLFMIHNVQREVVRNKLPVLLEEIRRMPEVDYATISTFVPGHLNESHTDIRTADQAIDQTTLVSNRRVGYDYFSTYDIPLITGRDFDRDRNDVSATVDEIISGVNYVASVIINQSGLRSLGLGNPEEALGKIIYRRVGDPAEGIEAGYEVIGVVNDLHLQSLKSNLRPEIFLLQPDRGRSVTIRYNGDAELIVDKVRNLWSSEINDIPFDFEHVSDAVAQQYLAEQGQASMFAAFSGLAIIIACLGLYGLASFTTESRTKEIGIRKVMGARVLDIVRLLLWQFSKPVIIANLIAWPLSFYAMSVWLESFAYRIENLMIIGFCLMAGISALFIAWGTVASNSIRVARTNPIKALRYE